MQRAFKEPLFHFLIVGALLFVAFGLVSDQNSSVADARIVVSSGRIEQLSNIFTKTWQRPPTREELQGLIDDFVLEEIYYRQAVAMGIDRDDTVIRRRLRQKLEVLTDDMAAAAEPSDQELSAFLTANPDVFRRQSAYTFEQVYINPEKYGAGLKDSVAEQLTALRAGQAPAGVPGLLATSFRRAPRHEVDGTFGSGFSINLDELGPGEWEGPFQSGLGLHLIRLESRTEGTVPDLAEIRPVVGREWANERRIDTRRKINEMLLDDYEVVIEWPTGQTEVTAEAM